MTPIKNFPHPVPPGLTVAIEANGIVLVNEGGVWKANDATAAEAVRAAIAHDINSGGEITVLRREPPCPT